MFVAEDAATGRQPTVIDEVWLNGIQEELAGFIEWAGLVLLASDNTQLRQALLAKFATLDAFNNHAEAADPHPQYMTAADSDAVIAAAVAQLVNSSPALLDTLSELAAALGNDPNFATTVVAALATKITQAAGDARYDPLGSAADAAAGLFGAVYDVTSGRALGGSGYTNNTGKPMVVFAQVKTVGNSEVTITVDDIMGGQSLSGYNASSWMFAGATAMVPAGSTYIISSAFEVYGAILTAATETY
jgi:hypothetical protein